MPDDEDLAEAMRLERELLEPRTRADPSRLDALLHPDFTEFGASGRRWDRDSIVQALLAETADGADRTAAIQALAARAIAPAAILVTYEVERLGRRTLRSSIWTWSAGGWSVLFHQGTVIPVDARDDEPGPGSLADGTDLTDGTP